MKKLSIITAALLLSVLTLTAQQTQTRTVTVSQSFDGIHISGTQTVHFEIGPAGPITIIGTAEDVENTVIKVNGSMLDVGFRKGYRSKSRQPVQVYVKSPNLNNGSVSGTGTLDISGKLDQGTNKFSVSGTGVVKIERIECRELNCTVSGTGDVKCDQTSARKISASVSGTGVVSLSGIEAETVTGSCSGTGVVNLSGDCQVAKLTCSGTGNIQAGELTARDVNAVASGTGNIYCYSTGKFEGNTSGIGRVHLGGNPETVNFKGNSNKLIEQ